MKKKHLNKIKKMLSTIIAAAITTNMLVALPASAEDEKETYFSYNGYEIKYSIPNEWNSGQNVEITVTNTGSESILNWAFRYETQGKIEGIWNANIYDQNGSEYIIKNSGWNYEIKPEQSVTFGYTLTGSNLSVPEKFDIWSSRVEAEESEYDAKLDISNSWDTGLQGQIVINNLSDEPLEAWKIEFDTNFTINNLWNGRIIECSDNHYSVASEMWSNPIQPGSSVSFGFTADIESGKTANIENIVLSKVVIGDPFVDTDGDGIPDIYELEIGTDKKNPDTDGDDISDYNELHIGSNPLSSDTDSNGIPDGEEDYDGDKLINSEEEKYGTDLTDQDTDNDGLSDYDEIYVYGTDPLNPDTDGDGISDGDEVEIGLNPLSDDTDGNGIKDSEEKTKQTFIHKVKNEDCVIDEVIIDSEATNNLKSTTIVESIYNTDILCSNVAGLIGEPFEIKTTSKFDTATITFKLDKNKLTTSIDNLLFLWYNEEENKFVEMETIYNAENFSVSTITTHFSKYMIVDSKAWYDAWAKEFNYNPSSDADNPNPGAPLPKIKYNTVLAIDCSGSMAGNDPIKSINSGVNAGMRSCQRIDASEKFIEYMHTDDKISIVFFTSSADIVVPMTSSVDELKAKLQSVYSNGGTQIGKALNTSITAFDEADIKAAQVNNRIILLSDGADEGSASLRKSAIDLCKEKGIKVYTVGLGSANETTLRQISDETGGEYFKAITSSELVDIFTEIGYSEDFDMTDTDLDGLPDAVESAGVRLQNGQIIYGCDPKNPDTDYDGILDGEEINPKPKYSNKTVKYSDGNLYHVEGYYFTMESDPTNPDTDYDYFKDDIDAFPKTWDSTIVYDEYIDDSESINGINPSIDIPYRLNGTLSRVPIGESSEAQKNVYTFTRSKNIRYWNGDDKYTATFEITPNKTGVYSITVTNVTSIDDVDIRVRYTDYVLFQKNIVDVKQIDQPSYFDETNKTATFYYELKCNLQKPYEILINNNSHGTADFDVIISQDNWVYAPNGAMVEYYTFNSYTEKASIYIDAAACRKSQAKAWLFQINMV